MKVSKRKLLFSVVVAFVLSIAFTTLSTTITDSNTVSAKSVTYSIGSKGSGVKSLQSKLRSKGYKLSVDGIYGSGTRKQVRNFQRDNGLTVDGIAGKQTHVALSKSTTKPSKSVTKSKNVVDKMTKLGKSQQVILVTTKGMNNNKGQVRTFEKNSKGDWNQKLSATAYVGENGLAHNKREGDLRSPTGKYSIGHAFGYNGNPGTKLPFKASTSNDVWVDDSNSKFYNTWQKKNNKNKDWKSAEEMTHELYKYGFIINYNTAQTPNKGSAIFMHVARTGTGYTTGCTATSQGNLLKVMNWIDPAKNPVIIQDVESNLGKY